MVAKVRGGEYANERSAARRVSGGGKGRRQTELARCKDGWTPHLLRARHRLLVFLCWRALCIEQPVDHIDHCSARSGGN